jgi:hypothetical protein
MSTKGPNEKRIRKKILSALRQKTDGKPTRLKQSELNTIVGKASVRAAYLNALLHTMQDEQLIDHHYWQTDTTRKRSCVYWAMFKHPENIIARARRVKSNKRQEEPEEPPFSLLEYARRLDVQNANRRAKEKFQKDFDVFLAQNSDEVLDVIRRIYRSYSPKTQWLHSRHWLDDQVGMKHKYGAKSL